MSRINFDEKKNRRNESDSLFWFSFQTHCLFIYNIFLTCRFVSATIFSFHKCRTHILKVFSPHSWNMWFSRMRKKTEKNKIKRFLVASVLRPRIFNSPSSNTIATNRFDGQSGKLTSHWMEIPLNWKWTSVGYSEFCRWPPHTSQ